MENNGTNKIFLRFFFVYVFFLLMGILAVGGIISVQFLSKDKVTAEDIYKEQVLLPLRGSILASDGSPLAVSTPVFELRWDSKVVPDSIFSRDVDSLALCLNRIFRDKSKSAWRSELVSARRSGNRYKLIGSRKVDFGELEEIRSFPIFRLGQYTGGLIVNRDSERINPYGHLASRTVGYLNADSGERRAFRPFTECSATNGFRSTGLRPARLSTEWTSAPP